MSSVDPSKLVVQHDEPNHRFIVRVGAQECVAEYEVADGIATFTHTFVPPELRGRGIAEMLVRTALDYARRERLRVIPACSYVATFIRRHREYVDLTT